MNKGWWTPALGGLATLAILFGAWIYHSGVIDTRMDRNEAEIASIQVQHKEDVAILRAEHESWRAEAQRDLKELEIKGVGRDNVLIDLQLRVAQMAVTLEHIDQQLTKLVERNE